MHEIFHKKWAKKPQKDSIPKVTLSELESFSTIYFLEKCYLTFMGFISSYVKW